MFRKGQMNSQPHGSATSRIPGLDGMRAVAIFTVIALHVAERFHLGEPGTVKGDIEFFVLGRSADGVGIFFVLSGFLITSLLLKEYEKLGKISLKDFYLRRVFRILPPLYVYLLFAIIFSLFIQHALAWNPMIAAAFFYRDYAPAAHQWITEHTWSLSVEEQFYMLWPPLLMLALNRGGRSAAATAAALLIAATPMLRVFSKLSHVQLFDHRETFMLHTRIDALMCGCLIALLIGEPGFERFFARIAKIWWILPLEFFVLSGVLYLLFGATWKVSVGFTIDSIAIALFLLWVARNEHSWVGKFLNSRLMVTAGVLSYSAYLWQTFFLHEANPTWLNHMPWCLAWIWLAAWLSYTLVEQPTLSLRKRIQRTEQLRKAASIELSAQDSNA